MNVTQIDPQPAADRFAETVTRHLRSLCRQTAAALHEQPTLDDLATIPGTWARWVDQRILPHVSAAYRDAAEYVRGQTGGEALPADAAERQQAAVRSRLLNIGNAVWETARDQLLTGVQAHEDRSALAKRLARVTPELAAPRAAMSARAEIRRAAAAAGIAQIRAGAVAGTKTWVAVNDDRTRPEHAAADGQTVPIGGKFDIGGWPLDYPGDDTVPPDMADNCRCTITYELDVPGGVLRNVGALTADADAQMAGAMVALVPTSADVKRLAVDGGEAVDQLHLTLFYLGDAADWGAQARADLIAAAEALFAGVDQFTADGFGINYWNPAGDTPAYVLAVGDPPEQQGILTDVRDVAGTAVGGSPIPAQHSPWVPHIALTYSTDPGLIPDLVTRVGSVSFDRARVAFGEQVTDIPLGGE